MHLEVSSIGILYAKNYEHRFKLLEIIKRKPSGQSWGTHGSAK